MTSAAEDGGAKTASNTSAGRMERTVMGLYRWGASSECSLSYYARGICGKSNETAEDDRVRGRCTLIRIPCRTCSDSDRTTRPLTGYGTATVPTMVTPMCSADSRCALQLSVRAHGARRGPDRSPAYPQGRQPTANDPSR